MKRKILFASLVAIMGKNRHNSKKLPKSLSKNYENILVLSSGGSMGLAWHLATLERLEDSGEVKPNEMELIIGTSAGSIASILLSLGKTLPELSKEILLLNKKDLFATNPQKIFTFHAHRKIISAFSGYKIPHYGMILNAFLKDGTSELKEIEKYINNITNSQWPARDIWLVTADAQTGSRVILHKKSKLNPGVAVISSCAVPALFTPIVHGKRKYIDGGMISSSHVDLALRTSAKNITLLTTSKGFTNPFKNLKPLVLLNSLNQNIEELELIKAIFWAKLAKKNLKVIRPRPQENLILRKNRLMDTSLMEELINTTLAK